MILGTRAIGVALLAPLFCAVTVLGAFAAARACDTPLVTVDTPDRELHERVCDVVASALPMLERCQLELTNSITINFSDGLGYPNQLCLGLYHHGDRRIELLNPDAFEDAHVKSALWTSIPVAEHFNSIVVHELTHAHVGQVAPAEPPCRADWEYVAYAMQIESLRASTRDAFIAGAGAAPPVTIEEVNSITLVFSPPLFAAKAWLHFSDPENGCDFVGKIIRGERTLMMLPE